jgi:TfoX/Sxy family transcriptional regulator of competence genes
VSTSSEFLEFITEQMVDFGPVSVRRMFGGAGIFRDGLMFALVVDGFSISRLTGRRRQPLKPKASVHSLMRPKITHAL